ncbi:MAG: HAMP domain-containing protein [Nitrospirae bacterium]|nr:HAMP domain-containing protein [Candidatus Manganitrophaceae bacterium]
MPLRSLPIHWKWTAAALLLSMALILLVGGLMLWSFKRYALRQIEQNLSAQAALAAPLFVQPLLSEDPEIIDRVTDLPGPARPSQLTVIRPDGSVAGDSSKRGGARRTEENPLHQPEVEAALAGHTATAIRFSETAGTELFYLAQPIQAEGKLIGIIHLAFPLSDVFSEMAEIRRVLWIVLGAVFLGSIFIGYFLSKRLTAPLLQMAEAAQSIAQGSFRHRVRIRSEDEMEALGEALNQMADGLQRKIQDLSDDRAKTLALLSGMLEGVLVLDSRGRILLTNASFERIFALSGDAWIGRYHYERLRHHPLNTLIEEVIQSGKPLSRELQLGIAPRPHLHVQASVTDQTPASVVLVFHDISEIKRLERMRKDFVANVSHELRTPLAAIKGYLETLVDGGLENREEAKEFLTILQKHTDRMANLVRDLLQLSRIESGLDPIRPAPINLREAVQRNLILLKPLSEKRGQTLDVSIAPELSIQADPEKLSHVLINLLDNAIKYTPERGKITVSASERTDAIWIEVQDAGIGIPREDLDRIFERFYRVDRTRSRELGGTGLGLSIVKHIMEAHGGKVFVESEIGKGSRFVLVFPKTAGG